MFPLLATLGMSDEVQMVLTDDLNKMCKCSRNCCNILKWFLGSTNTPLKVAQTTTNQSGSQSASVLVYGYGCGKHILSATSFRSASSNLCQWAGTGRRAGTEGAERRTLTKNAFGLRKMQFASK